MTLLPPAANGNYQGAPSSAWFLLFYSIALLGPGLIHSFLPDGGAGVIGGLDLSQDGARTIALFAWAGATQIAFAIVMMAISLLYRPLVPVCLLAALIERSLMSLSGWVRHVPVNGHHPPEHYGSLIAVPLIAIFLWKSLQAAPRISKDLT